MTNSTYTTRVIDFYRAYTGSPMFDPIRQMESDFIAKRTGNKSTILDIGCGKGQYEKIQLITGSKIVGLEIDISLFPNSPYFMPLVSDGVRLPFIGKCFDYLLCTGHVLGHLDKLGRYALLGEMSRVLKRDGSVFLSLWISNKIANDSADMAEVTTEKYSKSIELHFFDRSELSHLFNNTGFTTEEVFCIPVNEELVKEYFIAKLNLKV